jgi:hypothetical protein
VVTVSIWSSPIRDPGWTSSARISILSDVPTDPDQAPKMTYRVPVSLWLVENNHHFVISRVAEI